MWEYIEERARKCAEYIVETGCTVRACSAHFRISKSTVHKDITERLLLINQSLAKEENAFALLHLAEFEEFSKILDESKCKVTFTGDERDRIEAIIDILNVYEKH